MAPFDKPCTTFYWFASITIALYHTNFELYDVINDIVTWKLEITQGHYRVSILTRDIDIANVSVCLSVCPSVCPSVRP